MKRVAKPQTRLGAPKQAPEAKFALGTRPSSVRGKPPQEPKPFKMGPTNTRDYGTKTSPAIALQPGNPIGATPAPLNPTAPALTGV